MNRAGPRWKFPLAAIASMAVLMAWSGAALAKTPGGFSSAEMKAIHPLFDQYGLVALAETNADGTPKAMTLAIRVNTPKAAAFAVFKDPEKFSYISRLFRENKVREEHDGSKAFTWASRHKWFSFTGTNSIALYPPRRVDVAIVKSSVGTGSFRILFFDDGPGKSIVVLNGLLDVQSSEWLIRYLVGVNPAMRMAMNMAIGIVVVKGVKAMAERTAAGKPLDKHRTRGKRKGALRPLKKAHYKALEPLLKRGQVVMTRSLKGGKLAQATVVDRVRAPSSKFLVATATPELYPRMVKAITDIVIHERSSKATEFSWTLGFSVFGLTSRNRLTFAPDGVLVEGLDGDLPGALWRWQIKDRGPNESIVAYHGWANMSRTPYILKQSCKAEPYLEHGFMAGSNMVMLRAIKRVVEKQ